MFDFFMNQETAVCPKEMDPATLFFSSSSNLLPSVSEENNHSQTDPILSTVKANLSRLGQLMDTLAVRARIVSDSEVQNLRKEASLVELLPKEQPSIEMASQSQSKNTAKTVPPTSAPMNATATKTDVDYLRTQFGKLKDIRKRRASDRVRICPR